MEKRNTAFTLIELVVTLTIIAILAAVALPRYINLQSQARAAKLSGIYGAVRSAAALAKAQCLVDLSGVNAVNPNPNNQPLCTNVGGTVNMDGQAIAMINQYPAASTAGIQAAAQINPNTDGIQVTISGSTATFAIVGASTPGGCQFSYQESLGPGQAPIYQQPVTTGC